MTAIDLETWLRSMDRSCIARVLSAYGFPVCDKQSEDEVRDALRTLVRNGSIDLRDRITLAA